MNTKLNYHLKNILPWPKGLHIDSLHCRCGGSMDVSFLKFFLNINLMPSQFRLPSLTPLHQSGLFAL